MESNGDMFGNSKGVGKWDPELKAIAKNKKLVFSLFFFKKSFFFSKKHFFLKKSFFFQKNPIFIKKSNFLRKKSLKILYKKGSG